ncbi:MAG: type II secretion system protein [Acidovorax sp.]|nr:type II secretion system protein [Acidovorax sp.]
MKLTDARIQQRVRGFTLLELMVVFAIMALIVGVMPAAFDRMREAAQYRNTVRTMLSDMRTARQQSLAGRGDARFTVNLQQKTYGIHGGKVRELPDVVRVKVTVAGTEMQSGSASIRFLSDGGATGGSVDVLRNDSGGIRLRVDWLSGRITQEQLSQ